MPVCRIIYSSYFLAFALHIGWKIPHGLMELYLPDHSATMIIEQNPKHDEDF